MIHCVHLNDSGVVVVPQDILDRLELKPGVPLSVEVGEAGEIILKGNTPQCVFCGERRLRELSTYRGRRYCYRCFNELIEGQDSSLPEE